MRPIHIVRRLLLAGWRSAGAAALISLLVPLVALAAPRIKHSTASATPGEDVTIRAEITSDADVMEPFVSYRNDGGAFHVVDLKHKSRHLYVGVIPASAVAAGPVEYYLGAYDSADLSEGFWRSKDKPAKLKVRSVEDRDAPSAEASKPAAAEAVAAPEPAAPPPARAAAPAHAEAAAPPAPQPAPAPTPTPPPEPPAPIAAAPPPTAPVAAAVATAPGESIIVIPQGIEAGFGYLRIVTDPPGAQVSIDGSRIGRSPVVKAIGPGDYILAAELKGHVSASRVVAVKADVGKEILIGLTAR